MPDRVVYDTNVWISGLVWRGKPYQCLLLARGGAVQHLDCVEMMAELSRKLREPFGFSESHLQAVLADYRRISEQVQTTGTLQLATEDPDDDKFIERALVGGATAIGSGDHHLLNLEKHECIAILSAADFLDRVARPTAP